MANATLNYEDYPAIGDVLIASFTRDQPEFVVYYKTMDAAYIAEFANAINAVRETASVLAKTEERKGVTRQLYNLADEINRKLLFLIDYSEDSGLETATLSAIRTKLTKRNIEGAIKDLRNILPYLQSKQSQLEEGDMPDGFLDYFPPLLPQMEAWNAEQISILSNRKALVEANAALFENAYSYISKISNRGKKIFKKTIRKDDYTISKLLTKIRTEAKARKNIKSEDQ